MRRIKWSIFIVVLVACCLLSYRLLDLSKESGRGSDVPPDVNVSNARHPEDNDALLRTRIEKLQGLVGASEVPIRFYGKVVDQDEAPLADVKVKWRIGRAGYFSEPKPIKGELVTNARGEFSLDGTSSGRSLNIEEIVKEGYRKLESNSSFGYGDTNDPHNPEPEHPIVFVLVEKDLPKMKHLVDGTYSIAWNKGETHIPVGIENLQIQVSGKRMRKDETQVSGFEWSMEISMSNAEIVEIEALETSAVLAPSKGYQKSVKIGYAADAKTWKTDRQIAYKTISGLYGKIRLSVYPEAGENSKCLHVDNWVNMSGGRYLK